MLSAPPGTMSTSSTIRVRHVSLVVRLSFFFLPSLFLFLFPFLFLLSHLVAPNPLPPSPHVSVFLGNIRDAFLKDPALPNLLLDDFFASAIMKCQDSWRKVVSEGALHGIPTPCFSTALSFFDGYRCVVLTRSHVWP